MSGGRDGGRLRNLRFSEKKLASAVLKAGFAGPSRVSAKTFGRFMVIFRASAPLG